MKNHTGKALGTVHGGISGFPYGNRAAINKQIAINKGLYEAGCDAKVLNRKGVYTGDKNQIPPASGDFEGVVYSTGTGRSDRPGGFFKRNLTKLRGWRNEFKYLKELKRKGELDVMILDSSHFDSILFFRWITRRLKVPLVYHYVEMRSKIEHGTKKPKLAKRMGNKYLDDNVHKLFDGILAISDVLANHVKSLDSQKPTMVIPALCDYKKFEIPRSNTEPPFFLYCGGVSYSEVIKFVLHAFDKLDRPDDVHLYMILNGNKAGREAIYEYAATLSCADKVKFFYMIPYDELAQKYRDAKALLIPLRDTIQDKARFPHKVSEYLASQNPVITTNYGELAKYFVDMDNGLVADSYDLELYQAKMQWVLNNPEEAVEIGMRGYQMGKANFHFKDAGVNMKNFLMKLAGKELSEQEKAQMVL